MSLRFYREINSLFIAIQFIQFMSLCHLLIEPQRSIISRKRVRNHYTMLLNIVSRQLKQKIFTGNCYRLSREIVIDSLHLD